MPDIVLFLLKTKKYTWQNLFLANGEKKNHNSKDIFITKWSEAVNGFVKQEWGLILNSSTFRV